MMLFLAATAAAAPYACEVQHAFGAAGAYARRSTLTVDPERANHNKLKFAPDSLPLVGANATALEGERETLPSTDDGASSGWLFHTHNVRSFVSSQAIMSETESAMTYKWNEAKIQVRAARVVSGP